MMELAALIAAVFWALLVCAGVFVLFRLSRVLSQAGRLIERAGESLDRSEATVERAAATVDRAGRQLDATQSVIDELGTGMTELAGQVGALAGLGRAITAGPLGRVAALAYGVRHAVALRRPEPKTGPRALPGRVAARAELERARR
jgi:hypothetical protein